MVITTAFHFWVPRRCERVKLAFSVSVALLIRRHGSGWPPRLRAVSGSIFLHHRFKHTNIYSFTPVSNPLLVSLAKRPVLDCCVEYWASRIVIWSIKHRDIVSSSIVLSIEYQNTEYSIRSRSSCVGIVKEWKWNPELGCTMTECYTGTKAADECSFSVR